MRKINGLFYKAGKAKGEQAQVIPLSGRIELIHEEKIDIRKREEFTSEAPLPNCPLIIEFKNGDRFESSSTNLNKEDFNLILKKESRYLHFLENNKIAILGAFSFFIFFMYVMINHGGPFISKELARNIPLNVAAKLDKPILSSIDKAYLKPSELELKKQKELEQYFKEHTDLNINLYFRKGGRVGANAFALSGETIIFTDELVKHIEKKEYLLSIFLHEVGHLEHRHVISSLMSAAIFNAISFFVIGDLSGITESLGNIAYTVAGLKHTRSFESSADMYSVKMLKKHGLSVSCFTEGMRKLQEANKNIPNIHEAFSTHPKTKNRIAKVKSLYPNAKPCL